MFQSIKPVFPELIVLLGCLAAMIAGLYPRTRHKVDKIIFASMGLALIALKVINVPDAGLYFEKPLFVVDPFAVMMKALILTASLFAFAFGTDWLRYKKFTRFEYGVLIGFSVLGMMISVSADSFLMQFLGLEVLQMPLVFLTAFKRMGERSTEAGTKCVIAMIIGSGIWLFGASVIYACFGSADFSIIAAANKQAVIAPLLFGVSFLTAGFCIKIGIVPFHLWLPDVYEGAPSPVSAFYGVVVRIALLAAFARVIIVPFGDLNFYWTPVLSCLAILCVFGGAFGQLVQTNIKRFAAYTVILSNGFVIASLAADKVSAFVMFMLVSSLMLLGLFAILMSLRVGTELSEDMKILNGQGVEKPVRGALFSLIFFGLLGLPPFSGFWGRFFVWEALFKVDLDAVAGILMLGSVLPAYVFLKLVRQMYFVKAGEELLPAPEPMRWALMLSAGAALFLPFFLEPLGRLSALSVMAAG